MCGRYTLTVDKDELSERFGCPVVVPDYRPRYNAAPSQLMPVFVDDKGKTRLQMMKWGLVPYWAQDASIGSKLINARAETAAGKPAFRDAFRRRPCLVPADGYYEWMKTGKYKQPMRIVLKSRELFAFAGLWDSWTDEQGKTLFTYTILTTEPAESLCSIHNRMPLILKREDEPFWLNPVLSVSDRIKFLSAIKPADAFEAYEVERLVNSPANDSPELILPLSNIFSGEC